ncbi:MAG: type II toxin-antitoxin system RelB/DinJ family antitoxin [Desulfovibrio sp.]|nr:type II toxin-antitoxin system RelB/DinJ family antitoxin [Desulfovibrio sp.]
MSQTSLNVRMDSSLKKQFDAICAEFGMTPSTAVNIFARTIVRERRIPFEISLAKDPFYGEANMRRLRAAMEQLDCGNGRERPLLEDEDQTHA